MDVRQLLRLRGALDLDVGYLIVSHSRSLRVTVPIPWIWAQPRTGLGGKECRQQPRRLLGDGNPAHDGLQVVVVDSSSARLLHEIGAAGPRQLDSYVGVLDVASDRLPFVLILASRACASARMRTTEVATLANAFGSVLVMLG